MSSEGYRSSESREGRAEKRKEEKEERETVSRDKPEKHILASHDIPKALNVLEL